MSVICELKDVEKSYGERRVLCGVSLSLEAGKMYALLGRNGAGKSTLMRILARYEQPDSGYAFLFGRALDAVENERQHPIGYVSEVIEYALPIALEDYYPCFRSIYRLWDQSIVDKFLKSVDISPKQQFSQLSRGQRLQAAYGIALASQPRVMLLDEITSVLDAHGRAYVMDQLGRFLRGGGTILIATNIITELRNFPDHLCLLGGGELTVNEPIKGLQQRFVKLRAMSLNEHPVLSDSECCEVSLNTDGTFSYMIPKVKVEEIRVPDSLVDRRGITVEDFFIYFTRSKR